VTNDWWLVVSVIRRQCSIRTNGRESFRLRVPGNRNPRPKFNN